MAGIDEGLVEQAMTAADADAALPLSVEAGWNQTLEDWRFMLAQGRAVGIRDAQGRWIGSSLILPLGDQLSWISMVLVARKHRRHGVGTRLLRRCIEAVRSGGAAAGLDATELGRPVYLPLGFRDLYPTSRWRLDIPGSSAPKALPGGVRPLRGADLADLLAFDEPRSAMRRGAVLRYLSARAPQQGFLAELAGQIVGYVLGRPGRTAFQIGPLVADDENIARMLVTVAIAAADGPVMIDVPDAHAQLQSLLEQRGGLRERGFTRMVLGETPAALARPHALYALAGPELG